MKTFDLKDIAGEIIQANRLRADLEYLCRIIGGRMAGSGGYRQAAVYCLEQFRSCGLEAWFEKVPHPVWKRGNVVMHARGLCERSFHAVSLGNVPSTPPGGIDALVVDVGAGTEEDFVKAGRRIEGHFALATAGSGRPHRTEILQHAIKAGCAGLLYASDLAGRIPVTGTAGFPHRVTIPGLGLNFEDGLWISWASKQEKPLTIHIEIENSLEQGSSPNVVTVLPGSEFKDKIVLVGAHLDSWDLGEGALDNGCGAAVVLEVARTFMALNLRPAATICFALFTAEENGLYGSRYFAARKHREPGDIRLVFNLDMPQLPYGFQVHRHKELVSWLEKTVNIIAPLGLDLEIKQHLSLHSDHLPFLALGIPTMSLMSRFRSDGAKFYHSSADTYDKIDHSAMIQACIVTAITVLRASSEDEWHSKKLSTDALCSELDEKSRLIMHEENRLITDITKR